MGNQEARTRRARWIRGIAFAAVGIAAVVALVLYWKPFLGLLSQQERLRQWVAGFGWAAPLALILAQAAQVILAPVPGQVVGLVSGYLFGTLWGTVYSMAGILLGAWVSIGLARKLGRPFIERFVPAEHLQRFDGLLRKGGPTAFFLLFLLPFVPDDSICILAGLSPVPLSLLMILAAVGRFPSILASSFIGSQSASLTPGQWAVLAAVSLAAGVPILIYRERLEAFTERLTRRLSGEEGE